VRARRFDPPRPAVVDVVARALAEDLGPLGDISAALLDDPDRTVTAAVVPRVPGVLAGSACADETYAQLDPRVTIAWSGADGDPLVAGVAVAQVTGPLGPLLTGERTALNFLCHLSGIATLTRRFVDAAAGHPARIVETRKTLPGLRALEKAAVRAGGGANHRGTLSDLVLVKDNHLGGLGIAEAVQRARAAWPGRGVEIECDRPEQVDQALAAGADVVMLDNMTPDAAAACVARVRASARPTTVVEISGGVTLETVAAYAATGADVISTGAITQSAPALDLGLDLGVG
jgi:nicotinate-nucleotide pyrophosphorylase (carboxylating)